MKKQIVIVGTICGSKTFHGPFEDTEHAHQWAYVNVGKQRYEIAPLEDTIPSKGLPKKKWVP